MHFLKRNRGGFTLVEILGGIAIIAILSGVLLGQIFGHIASSERSSISNMEGRLNHAMEAYVSAGAAKPSTLGDALDLLQNEYTNESNVTIGPFVGDVPATLSWNGSDYPLQYTNADGFFYIGNGSEGSGHSLPSSSPAPTSSPMPSPSASPIPSATPVGEKGLIISPSAGVLPHTSGIGSNTQFNTTFTWSAGEDVTSYHLMLGSSAGSGDIYSTDVGLSQTANVLNIPYDGRALYATLTTNFESGGSDTDTRAYTAFQVARFASPAAGSLLVPPQNITWSSANGSGSYWLNLGSYPFGADILSTAVGSTSGVVPSVNYVSETVYATLYTIVGDTWIFDTRTFSVELAPQDFIPAFINSPPDNSVLPLEDITLTWNNITGASDFYLWAAGVVNTSVGTATSYTIPGAVLAALPQDSSIQFYLFTTVDGVTKSSTVDYRLPNATSRKGILTNPVSGSVLTDSNTNVSWDAGVNVSSYVLSVGNSPDDDSIFTQSFSSGVTNTTVGSLPMDGRIIYFNLWSDLSGTWERSSTVTVGAYTVSEMINPPNGATISTAPSFNWTPSSDQYALAVGSFPFGSDIFFQNTSATSIGLAGLPVGQVYVTLYTIVDGKHRHHSYTYIVE